MTTANTTITPELLDQLLANYPKPDDLTGDDGLFKRLKKALIERGQSRDREPADLRIVDAGIVPPQIDETRLIRRHPDCNIKTRPALGLHLPL
jgi:hypothetical protein